VHSNNIEKSCNQEDLFSTREMLGFLRKPFIFRPVRSNRWINQRDDDVSQKAYEPACNEIVLAHNGPGSFRIRFIVSRQIH